MMSKVLLVEDNEADAYVVRQCFEELESTVQLTVVPDGVTALDLLLEQAETERYRPDLVLLDLNLPGRHGKSVLRDLRNNASTRCLPIVIFSSSNRREDVDACYNLSANAYITKSMSLEGTRSSLEAVRQFWLKTAVLPTATQTLF